MRRFAYLSALLLMCLGLASCSSSKSVSAPAKKSSASSSVSSKSSTGGLKVGAVTTGQASYYSDKLHGNTTANGEKYDKRAMTCAHKTYPFGTMLKVTNTTNGKSVTLRVNDRGPFKAGRIVDVSGAAAEKLDMKTAGVVNVKVEIVKLP
ncbi:MAG: septal ring lytic transglycosylase RlpA family protein [Bacteroidales bacterium]|nr:septal ring lytic transglycosylase RlpA family protein [Bacteroidales bacterium]